MDFFSRVLNIEMEYVTGWTKVGGERDEEELFGVRRPPEEIEPGVFGGWFHRFHRLFLKEICGVCSYPPVLGDGKVIDLFKLFIVVREKGGYKKISKSGLWDCVARESGLGSCLSSSVKLIYFKYLDVFERWLEKVVGDRRNNVECKTTGGVNLSEYLRELGEELEKILKDNNKKDLHVNEDKHSELSGVKMCRSDVIVVVESGDENESKLNEPNIVNKTVEDICCEDMEKKGCVGNGVKSVKDAKSDGNKVVIDLDEVSDEVNGTCVSKNGRGSRRKRKHDDRPVYDEPMCYDDPMRKLLSLITNAAKEPGDPEITPPLKMSEWKYYNSGLPWKQALALRKTIFSNVRVHPSADQCKPKLMRPSIFRGSECSYNLRERIQKPPNGNDLVSAKKKPKTVFEIEQEDEVPIGPDHQAEIPEWTGSPSEDDLKWLGQRDWPPEKTERRIVIERDPIGKGRQRGCGCPIRNSVECVRFHVAEKSSKVKTEVGAAYFTWKFDKMGEKVEMSWSEEDRKTFETIMNKIPNGYYFWGAIQNAFPTKTSEMLVSYYYNVHVLRHRAHQNRFAPDDIGRDDESSKTQEEKDKEKEQQKQKKKEAARPSKKRRKSSSKSK